MRRRFASAVVALCVSLGLLPAGAQQTVQPRGRLHLPVPRAEVQRVATERGEAVSEAPAGAVSGRAPGGMGTVASGAALSTGSSGVWQPLGPASVSTAHYGLVTGRVSSIALDPADATGNRVYIGATGGGVWLSQNAATSNTADVQFVPLTDVVGTMAGVHDASITIGALTVQPGGTGVVLAGTGDPNNSLDSYYGGGILRSTDGGTTWSLIVATANQQWIFTGEAFAGFAWSTVNPQLVVAAVSQSMESVVANAIQANASYQGLYYSTDSGASWSLAKITDGGLGTPVQGPSDLFAAPDGNAVTSVVWNPMRKFFVAAVRAHGYYQSPDGVTWTRLSAQPGTGLTLQHCPTNAGFTGSRTCPIFRGTLAVNPTTGDTFAWTVDGSDQDQGLWQDRCLLAGGVCTNQNISFSTEWNTTALDTNDALQGPATVEDGDYTLTLAAVPLGQDTVLFAGNDDLWKCSLSSGCTWRNTTNTQSCKSAQVSPYQHALAWSATNPLELLIGNDSGLWRSLDGVGETGAACEASDATHFQNLNGGLGSLSEVRSLALVGNWPEMGMVGLGLNGTAGVKSAVPANAPWPQVLDGYGGVVAIDPSDSSKWYVNSASGVSIHGCSTSGPCTPADFGPAAVTNAHVGGDGVALPGAAPFVVDPLDPSQLLIGTCRVWRGPANGAGWSSANAISPILDGQKKAACASDPVIFSMAATALADGSEVIYAGMAGVLEGGGTLAGHVFRSSYNPTANGTPSWQDLTSNPVTNSATGMNSYGFDVSSLVIDPHDPTGNTIYVVVRGMQQLTVPVRILYRSTDGGAHWLSMPSNLPPSPANALAIDPQDANTVYLALDAGVYSTRQMDSCVSGLNYCWSAYGTGLPQSPVMQLSIAGDKLVAGTYGRGLWQIPLWTTGTKLTTAEANPSTLLFSTQGFDTTSDSQTITVSNQGSNGLTVTLIDVSGDFAESDNCRNGSIAAGASCSIQVTFTPTQAGARTGELTISANAGSGALSVGLSGTGGPGTDVTLTPPSMSFDQVGVGSTSATQQITVENATGAAIPVTSIGVSGPFVLSTNACGTALAAHSDCQLLIAFTPTQAGSAVGTLTMVDSAGAQTVRLSGNGAAQPTDALSPNSLTFQGTVVGQISLPQTIALANTGGLLLTSIAATTTGPFQVSSNCGTQLAPTSTCSFTVTFVPTATGAQTGVLTIQDALRTQSVSLSGTGLAPPQIRVNPTSLNFLVQSLGTASAPQTLTISNAGGSPMASIGFQVIGMSVASFSSGATNCGAVLNNGSSCTVQVVFTPVFAGGAAASLAISSSTLGVKAVQAGLTGTGQATNGLNVSPAQMTFTAGTIGQASAAQTVTLSNTSSSAASGLTLTVAPPFSVSAGNCGSMLAAGANCTAGLVFTASDNGSATGMLTATAASLNSAVVILNGVGGTAGSVQLQPALLNYSTVGVGTTSDAQTIAVSNSGPVDLAGFALNTSSGFRVASTTCAAPLVVGASCSASVVFAPTTAGQQTGSLMVASSALAIPAQAVLAGTGFDFAVSILGGSSQTISSGQTARFTLVLTPANGSSGTFAFACGPLPAIAACSFNPPTETVGANTTGNVMVQIATGGSARSMHPSGAIAWEGVSALCGLMLLPVAWRRKRGILLRAFLLALVMSAVVSCAGSGGGTEGPGSNGTGTSNGPVGTYSIPIQVTANGVVHAATVTLTVD